MSNKTLWTVVGVAILVFIAGLAIGLWTIPVKVPATESTPQTSVSTLGSGNAKAVEKAQEAENGEKGEQSDNLTEDQEKGGEKAQNAEDGEKGEQSDNLTEDQEKGGEE